MNQYSKLRVCYHFNRTMMGCSSSKMAQENGNMQVTEPSDVERCLEYFEEDCRSDSQLQEFRDNLTSSTARAVIELDSVTGGSSNALPLNTINVVIREILVGNSEVAKVILREKMDIIKDQDLISLVDEYFKSSRKIWDLCTKFEGCLRKAEQWQFLFAEAVRQFDEAPPEERVVKTQQILRKLKNLGDPFTRDFFECFQSVYEQQRSMFDKLIERSNALEKKRKSTKTWRKISTVVFMATFVSVLVLSVVAVAVAAPVVAALAGALTVPIGSIGKWCNSLWSKYIKQIDNELGLVKTMKNMTSINVSEMESIKEQVKRLELTMETIGNVADAHLAEHEALKLAVDEISKKNESVKTMLKDLEERVRKCRREVKDATSEVLKKVERFGER